MAEQHRTSVDGRAMVRNHILFAGLLAMVVLDSAAWASDGRPVTQGRVPGPVQTPGQVQAPGTAQPGAPGSPITAPLAQGLPDRVDLMTVLSLARDASPRLALERQGVAVAQAERRTAGAYPNPTVTYSGSRQPGQQTNFGSRRAHDISVDLPLLLGGQRSARVKAAERGIEAAMARAAASGNALAAEAGAAYVALLVAQEKRSVLEHGMGELAGMRGIVSGRESSGLASRYDLLRVDVEQASWHTQVAEAEADVVDRQGQLAALLGFRGWRPVAKGELHSLDAAARRPPLEEHPSVATARREEAAAQARAEVARRERFPAVSVNTGRFWTSDPYGYTSSLGVSVEIPLLDSRRGVVDKARAEAKTAEFQRQIVEAEVQADVRRYEALVAQRSAAIDHFRKQLGPRLPALKDMASDAYRLGRTSIIDLLDATRTRLETQISQIELTGALMEAQVRLQAARGELVADVDRWTLEKRQ